MRLGQNKTPVTKGTTVSEAKAKLWKNKNKPVSQKPRNRAHVHTKRQPSGEVDTHVAINGNSGEPQQVISYRSGTGTSQSLLPFLDRRIWQVKRYEEIYYSICQDMGGEDQLSTLQRLFIKQLAALANICEDMNIRRVIEEIARERGMPNPHGLDVCYDFLEHVVAMKTMNQLGKTLGMGRIPKDITNNEEPETLDDYLDAQYETIQEQVDAPLVRDAKRDGRKRVAPNPQQWKVNSSQRSEAKRKAKRIRA